jgi:hypothetical protein
MKWSLDRLPSIGEQRLLNRLCLFLAITTCQTPITPTFEVHASVSRLFRWLCQLRVAPYSYDWIDNFGRQSPRQLIPGLEKLEVGQRMMISQLVAFERDRHLTLLVTSARVQSIFGKIAMSYVILSQTEQCCRLVAKLLVRYPQRGIGRVMRILLPWGDLLMMRKQLLTFKHLAESQAV